MLIYRFALSQASHLYYKRIGQSPYPFVGRGFTPAAFSVQVIRHGGMQAYFASLNVKFASQTLPPPYGVSTL